MSDRAVTYSLKGCDDVLDPSNPFRRLAFLPASSDLVRELGRGRWDVLVHETLSPLDARFAKSFWYVQYVDTAPTATAAVASTDQILVLLHRGLAVLVVSGPFETEGAAQYDLDVRWESHD